MVLTTAPSAMDSMAYLGLPSARIMELTAPGIIMKGSPTPIIVGADLIAGKLHLQICHSGQVVGAYLLAGLNRQRLLEIAHFGLVVDIAHDAEASLSLILRGGQVGSTSGAIQHHTHADLQIDGGINVANVLHVLVVTNRLSLHCFSSLS